MRKRLVWIGGTAAFFVVLIAGGWLGWSILGDHGSEIRITRGPAPAFVIVHEPVPPADAKFDDINGLQILLLDQQYDATAARPGNYLRSVRKATTSVGVSEAAKVVIPFDPSYQKLVLNHARVLRNGVTEDRSNRIKTDFLRQEPAIAFDILTGQVTAILQLEDVREGDIVDIATTVYGVNPSLKGKDTSQYWLASPISIERFVLKVTWPQNAIWKVEGGVSDIKTKKANGKLTLEVEPQPLEALEFDSMSNPPDIPVLWVSSFADWADVEAWAAPLFKAQRDPATKEIVSKIKAEHSTASAQLIAALRFVQQDIRYLAIVLGEGGYVPQKPAQTLKLRYGDCKAKTALLLAILEELEIEAAAALVNPIEGEKLDERIASPAVFNHVIARVSLGDGTFWLDPTISQQGGDLEHIAQADYGYALVLDGSSTALQRIETPSLTAPQIEMTETFDLTGGPDAPVLLELSGVMRGAVADSMRITFAAGGGPVKTVLDGYKSVYQNVETVVAPAIEDNLATNTMQLSGVLKLKSPYAKMGSQRMMQASANSIGPIVFATEADGRKSREVAVMQQRVRHSLAFRLPHGPHWQLVNETQTIENEAFQFRRASRLEGDVYQVDFEMASVARSLKPEKIQSVLRDQGQLENMVRVVFWMNELKSKSLPPLDFPLDPAVN